MAQEWHGAVLLANQKSGLNFLLTELDINSLAPGKFELNFR